MQKAINDFNPEKDYKFNAVGISQHELSLLEESEFFIILNDDTDYRGDVLICTEDKAIGFAELVDVAINEIEPPTFSWKLTNYRQIIEIPCISQKGAFSTCFEAGDIEIYPKHVLMA